MRRQVIFAVFALMLTAFALNGCRSQELCPAYGDNHVEQQQENLS